MYRVFQADKDTYISDRVFKNQRKFQANFGNAGTLDLLKLYGVTFTSGTIPNNELSRILIKFDLTDLRALYAAGKIDTTNSSFNCTVNLFNVTGGQPVPQNFVMELFPLSKSFDEGIGRDIIFSQDIDAANFITSSITNGSVSLWNLSGANGKGTMGSTSIDVMTSGSFGAGTVRLWSSQSFTDGTEDLSIDVTTVMSATLAGLLPDYGFRLSFAESQENDNETRFVKRFGSRHASDFRVQPKLIVRYNDSIQDSQNNFMFDTSGSVFLYNYGPAGLTNLRSGSNTTQVTGQNSLLLKLNVPISGGTYTTIFTASQLTRAGQNVTGIYSASFLLLSNDSVFKQKLIETGSVEFTQIWASLDDTVGYMTSSGFVVKPQLRTTYNTYPSQFFVNVTNARSKYKDDEQVRLRVFIKDNLSTPQLTRSPQTLKSKTVNEAHYSIRDIVSNTTIIEFDTTYNSTMLSNDSEGMYFDMHTSTFDAQGVYVVDIMIKEGDVEQIFRDASTVFKIESA